MEQTLKIPELSLVVLIGPSGSGKSSFAKKHFLPTEILSSDYFRALLSDDETDQRVTVEAFDVLRYVASKRLALGRLTVIDATNVQAEARHPLIQLARQHHVMPVAIVLNLPEKLCHERNAARPDRQFGKHVVRQQCRNLNRSRRALKREGFRYVYWLNSEEDVNEAETERVLLWTNKKHLTGPFDVIGDVHGCFDELLELLEALGYRPTASDQNDPARTFRHPEGRTAIFLGDLVDRGPNVPGVLRTVMNMVNGNDALCVPGNHEVKLLRKLRGKDVRLTHGLAESVQQLEKESPEFIETVAEFIDSLVSHYVLDEGRLIVAHAGLREEMAGRASGVVRSFALYGDTTGETDEFGLPVRYPWAKDYRGRAWVVYGHTPVPEPERINRTVNIDTGCVFGGSLTALRYPENDLVSIKAKTVYYEPAKPLLPKDASHLSAQQQVDDVLDMEDVSGKRIIDTRLNRTVTIREENAAAALEVMSRFGVNPKWLIYLPPTMSPSETSKRPDLLEHPTEAFDYYRRNGVERLVCQEKHMGSRAVAIVCRDEGVARERFGIEDEGYGVCTTRTGRRFFQDAALEQALLSQFREALTGANTWSDLETDWICLDGELMPWSVKARDLLRTQYAATGSAAKAALAETITTMEQASSAGQDLGDLLSRYRERAESVDKYIEAYGRYCWAVDAPGDLKFAPFHIMATEGRVHVDKNHVWHMERAHEIANAAGEMLLATTYEEVDLSDRTSEEKATEWWSALTKRGGEGMVVKPDGFYAKGKRGLLQPAIKCRGREYLRIIYGPEYTAPEHLERLRSRGLSAKRSLALREFALGIEALERFVKKEPLRRVHECVFGVLALESEPVDPRL